MDKCWCGLELEDRKINSWQSRRVCPEHGEDYFFQPCPGAGSHWVAGIEPKHLDLRRCPAIRENVEPKNCAKCDRPALVAAVRDAMRIIGPAVAQDEVIVAAVELPQLYEKLVASLPKGE